MNKKHWIAGNGSIGCLYDNFQSFDTKRDAIESLVDLFYEFRGVKTNLQKYHIHYFDNSANAGADYCEIVECYCDNPDIHNDL